MTLTRRGTIVLVSLVLYILANAGLHAPPARGATAVAMAPQHYANVSGAYGLAYPAGWSTRMENRPTDVFVLAPDRRAGLRVLVLPESVQPRPALVQWLVRAIVQPVGRLTSTPIVRDFNVQGEDGLATAVSFHLRNGVAGVLIAMLVAHAGTLYAVVGAAINPHTWTFRQDVLQLAGVVLSLRFAAGGVDPSAYGADNYAPGNDWTYVGVGGDAGSDGQCSYYDDPDTGSSVMVGDC